MMARPQAAVTQLAECSLPKADVAGSTPVRRSSFMPPRPTRLLLVKDSRLEIDWADGAQSVFPIRWLRGRCPCATCKEFRQTQSRTRLAVIQKPFDGPIVATSGQAVGSYAIRLSFSDGHDTGLFSFEYLRTLHDLIPPAADNSSSNLT
jgi:DUF971 family protein